MTSHPYQVVLHSPQVCFPTIPHQVPAPSECNSWATPFLFMGGALSLFALLSRSPNRPSADAPEPEDTRPRIGPQVYNVYFKSLVKIDESPPIKRTPSPFIPDFTDMVNTRPCMGIPELAGLDLIPDQRIRVEWDQSIRDAKKQYLGGLYFSPSIGDLSVCSGRDTPSSWDRLSIVDLDEEEEDDELCTYK